MRWSVDQMLSALPASTARSWFPRESQNTPCPAATASPLQDSIPADDIGLLRRVAQCDRAAFETIYDRFSGRFLGLVWQIVASRAEAEDIVHDGFLVIWKRASEFDPVRGSPLAWMISIMRHRAIDALRRRRCRNTHLEALQAGDDAFDYIPATSGAETNEQRVAIQGALQQLGASESKVIQLAFFRGLTHHQIAEGLSLPVGTVKARIRRGMLKLRATLAAQRSVS